MIQLIGLVLVCMCLCVFVGMSSSGLTPMIRNRFDSDLSVHE